MKRIRKSRAARVLTWLLTVTMIAPVVLGMLSPVTGYAQNATPAGGVQTVIVIDFENKTNDPLGAVLARQATDATAVELANSARYEVLKRDEVIRTAKELGLKPPYDQIAKTKLANALGASSVIEGAVKFVKESTSKSGPRTIGVGLTIRVSESSSGDLLSGAAQIGEARSRAGQSDRDSLAQEAVGNSAVLAVRQILSYNLPEGTIVNTVGSGGAGKSLQILVNRGSRDGVTEGMQMIVLRDRQRVGRIRVTNVFPTDSECEPVENVLGIAPTDKVRAVFPMPDFTIRGELVQKTARTNPTRSVSALGKILLVLLVGLVIATAAKGGTTAVTGVVAEPDTVNIGPAVRIVWRDNLFGSGTQTLEYHIWRTPDAQFNFQGVPVAAVSGGAHTYTDLPFPFSYWDGVNSYLQPQFATGNGGGGNANQNTVQVVTPAAGLVSGFRQAGTTYIYQLTSIIRRPLFTPNTGANGGGGVGGGGGGVGGGGGGVGGGGGGVGGGGGGGGNNQGGTEDIETGTVTSGAATPLNKSFLQSPNDQAQNVALGAVAFSFQSVLGGDEFQVQVSTDRTFTNRNLIVSVQGFSTAADASGVTQAITADLSNNAILRRDPTYNNFINRVPGAPRPVLFYRVGFRNSGDRPGPVHAITKNHTDNDRTFRFIYSQVRSFSPADLPPPPP